MNGEEWPPGGWTEGLGRTNSTGDFYEFSLHVLEDCCLGTTREYDVARGMMGFLFSVAQQICVVIHLCCPKIQNVNRVKVSQ